MYMYFRSYLTKDVIASEMDKKCIPDCILCSVTHLWRLALLGERYNIAGR